jgi:hypothetical protein
VHVSTTWCHGSAQQVLEVRALKSSDFWIWDAQSVLLFQVYSLHLRLRKRETISDYQNYNLKWGMAAHVCNLHNEKTKARRIMSLRPAWDM